MNHYLITRYNVSAARDTGLSDAWLDHRLKLFTRFTVPSVRRQTTREFDWVILFDKRTTSAQVQAVTASIPIDVPTHVVRCTREWRSELAANLPSSGRILTSRLDNDDAIFPGFMSAVRYAATSAQAQSYFQFQRGYVYDAVHGILHRQIYDRNPFLSFLEEGAPLQTVLAVRHLRCPGPMIDLDGDGWMRVAHDRNISTRAYGEIVSVEEGVAVFNRIGVTTQ